MEHLEDVTPVEVLARMKTDIGLDRMIVLCNDKDPLVRAVAAESIGDEVIKNPKLAQQHIVKIGGVDALLSILNMKHEPIESSLPGLWSLREVLNDCFEAQCQFNYRDGIEVLLSVVGRCISGEFEQQVDKVLEAILLCFCAAIKGHERNSRALLLKGLGVIMDMVSGDLMRSAGIYSANQSKLMNSSDKYLLKALGKAGDKNDNKENTSGIISLAKSILQMLGPYNYVVCRTCHTRQNLSGTSCLGCGNKLLL